MPVPSPLPSWILEPFTSLAARELFSYCILDCMCEMCSQSNMPGPDEQRTLRPCLALLPEDNKTHTLGAFKRYLRPKVLFRLGFYPRTPKGTMVAPPHGFSAGEGVVPPPGACPFSSPTVSMPSHHCLEKPGNLKFEEQQYSLAQAHTGQNINNTHPWREQRTSLHFKISFAIRWI